MDTVTLTWTTVIVFAALAFLAIMVALYRKDLSVTVWAFGFCGSALGFTLLLVQALFWPWLPYFLGNFFLLTFHMCLLLGLGIFLGIPQPWKNRFTAYTALWILGMLGVSYVWPSYPIRASLTSAVIAVFAAETLVLSFRSRLKLIPLVRHLVWTFSLLVLLFHGVRLVLVLYSGSETLFADRWLTMATVLESLVMAVLWAGTLLFLDTGRLLSRLRASADELERLNRLKDRVLAMTSHDLRGPLGNLKLLWGELTKRLNRGDCREIDGELLQMVDRSLAGTQNLLENLFAFAESQQGGQDTEPVCSLAEAVGTVLAQWSAPAATKGVSLQAVSFPAAWGSAGLEAVTAVVRNLVGNAVKFTPSGGTVKISVADEAGQWALTVADSGIGMSPELLDRTFRMENRLSRPGTGGERGSGFGLVLVKELVGGWGGSLRVESAPGRGTSVTVTVPRRLR